MSEVITITCFATMNFVKMLTHRYYTSHRQVGLDNEINDCKRRLLPLNLIYGRGRGGGWGRFLIQNIGPNCACFLNLETYNSQNK